jgi:hypothetical protein
MGVGGRGLGAQVVQWDMPLRWIGWIGWVIGRESGVRRAAWKVVERDPRIRG